MNSPTRSLSRGPSLSSLVHEKLESRILSGKLKPGRKLVEEDVALDLGVSRGPVREAFRALAQAGLLHAERNRGVFVREISLREADEIYVVRAGLDQLAGRLLAERLMPEQLAELRALLSRMEDLARTGGVDEYYSLNVEFHESLVRFTGNHALLTTYRSLVNRLHLFRRATLARDPRSFPVSTREHANIVDTLAAGDGPAVARLLYDHAIESRERLHAALERSSPARRDARRHARTRK